MTNLILLAIAVFGSIGFSTWFAAWLWQRPLKRYMMHTVYDTISSLDPKPVDKEELRISIKAVINQEPPEGTLDGALDDLLKKGQIKKIIAFDGTKLADQYVLHSNPATYIVLDRDSEPE